MGSLMTYCMPSQHHAPADVYAAEHEDPQGPRGPFPSPDLTQNGPRSPVPFDPGYLFTSYFDQTASGAFASSDVVEPTSSYPSSRSDSFNTEVEFLHSPRNGFGPKPIEDGSGRVPKLPDLVALPSTHPTDDDMQWTTDDQGCPHSGQCCFALADKILRSLHVPSTLCLSATERHGMGYKSGQTGSRTAGAVFIANSEGIMALSRMLCCSCSLKTPLQLVMAASCDKLISWYYAIAKGEQNSDFDPSVTTTTTTHLQPNRNGSHKRRERILCQRVMVGDYCLDGAAEAQIMAHIVLAHLRRLDFLVNALSQRIKIAHTKRSAIRRERDGQASSHLEDGGILGLVSDSLTVYLLSRVKGAQKEAASLIGG